MLHASTETPNGGLTLSEAINAATSGIHTKINKLIIPRVALALPPNAQDPSLYACGLLHIAPVYLTFEALWKEMLETTPMDQEKSLLVKGSGRPQVSTRMHTILRDLAIPELMRSGHIKADIQTITGWSPDLVNEQLDLVSKTGHLGEFTSHIRRAIKNKPHVLISYSFLMFMALFNGGRYIRARLASAGPEFWNQVAAPVKPMMRPCEERPASSSAAVEHTPDLPLRFFHFKAAQDGEVIKREFKRILDVSEEAVTRSERADILQEAVCIFENIALVVAQLDAVMSEAHRFQSGSPVSATSMSTIMAPPLANRFRDSLVVTKERMAKASSEEDTRHRVKPVKEAKLSAVTEDTEATAQYAIPHPIFLSTDLKGEKAVRFKSLSQPAAVQLTESLKTASKQLRREQMTNWVILAAIGFIILGAAFSSRRTPLEA